MRGIRCTGIDGATLAGIAYDVFGAGQAVSGVANAAASIAGATIQANATKEAAKLATDSANRSADLVQKRYDTTRSDLMPYQETGQTAQPWLRDQAGVWNYYGKEYVDTAGRDNPAGNLGGIAVPQAQDYSTAPSIAQYSAVPGSMSQKELEATPGYKFNLAQGLAAVQNSASARGLGVSGAALKGAATFATGLADSTYQNQFNNAQTRFQDQFNKDNQLFGQVQTIFGDQLSKDAQNFGQQHQIFTDRYNLAQGAFGQAQQHFQNDLSVGQADQNWRTSAQNRLLAMSSLGANAAAQTGQAGTQAASAAGGFLTSGASAAGAGLIAGGNAWGGAINGIGNAYQQYAAQQQLAGASAGSTYRSGGYGSGAYGDVSPTPSAGASWG